MLSIPIFSAKLNNWNIFHPASVSFYSLLNGAMFNDSSPVREFLRRTIRYFIFIGIGLFGSIHELAKSETIRWPLLGGYLFVIAASAYGIRVRAREEGEDESAEH